MGRSAAGPLEGVRVLDVTDSLAAYGARLLADLGADVIRVEPPRGPGHCDLAPFWVSAGTRPTSLFERFVNAGKRSVTLDLAAPEAEPLVAELLAAADVLVESSTPVLDRCGWSNARVTQANPALVRVLATPYGSTGGGCGDPAVADAPAGTAADEPVDDLVLLGAGGLLHLGGYIDAGPVAVYGQQSTYMTSIFAAVAAVAGLIGRERTGDPMTADVSGQECVAQALEESVVRHALTGEVRSPQGEVAKEAGSGVYRCADGYVSIVAGRLGTAPAWDALVEWVTSKEPEVAPELRSTEWSQFEFRQRPEAIAAFRKLFEHFASSRTRQELYREAQAQGIALSPVNDIGAVLEDTQLRSRDFFVEVADPQIGQVLTYPGLPYRLGGTPLSGPRPAPQRGADNVDVYLKEIGLTAEELECLAERGVV